MWVQGEFLSVKVPLATCMLYFPPQAISIELYLEEIQCSAINKGCDQEFQFHK